MLATLWIVLRAVHFFAVLLLAGSAFYTALLAPRGYRSRLAQRLNAMMAGAAVLSAIGAVLMLNVQSGLMSGDWRNIVDGTTIQIVLSTHWGHVWCAVIIAALLSLLTWQWQGARRQALLLLTSLLQLILLAGVGHAAMREGWLGWLQQSNHALHLIGAAFWSGGLLPVLLLMREARQIAFRGDAIRAMMRFSRYGHLAVALVLLTGIINGVLIAGNPLHWQRSLWSTLLWIKVLLVGLMVTIALVNRYLLVPRFSVAGSQSAQLFIRLTQCELLVAMIVVGLVSVLATLSPA